MMITLDQSQTLAIFQHSITDPITLDTYKTKVHYLLYLQLRWWNSATWLTIPDNAETINLLIFLCCLHMSDKSSQM